MRSWLLVLVIVVSVQAIPRGKRQNCECSPGQAPKCGCQVMPTPELGGGQMICTCSKPVPPKCACTEGNVKNIIALPALLKTYNCVTTCEGPCLDSCQRLNFNTKCGTICNEACQFTCSKQEISTTPTPVTTTTMATLPSNIQEYRFVIPAGALQTTTSTTVAPKTLVLTQNVQIQCPSECQPSCSFVCTRLRPTLKVITQMFDAKTDETTCKTSCSSACLAVCGSSGVSGNECQSNCAPACEDTCTIVKPVTTQVTTTTTTTTPPPQCLPMCMPTCSQHCLFSVQIQLALQQATDTSTTEPLAQTVLIPIAPAPVPTSTNAPTLITLGAICRNECLVQCEHQCMPSNPNCMAACQTTCYPVCQTKMRRRMKEAKIERYEE